MKFDLSASAFLGGVDGTTIERARIDVKADGTVIEADGIENFVNGSLGLYRSRMAGVELEPVLPSEPGTADDPERPRQRSVSVEDNGMGDLLRFDAERLRVLVEKHLL